MSKARRWLRFLAYPVIVPYHYYRLSVARRVRRALLWPLLLQGIGTVGYPAIEGEPWTLFDGAYMTAITLATIGYGEVYPLSSAGRVFTIFLSYSGIFTLAYFGSELVRSVVTGELRDLLGRERMEEQLRTLSGHVVVCGIGRMGKIVCDELERERKKFVVIERNPVLFADWNYEYGIKLSGDATEDEMLRKAGVERAKALITSIASDADNLYVTLSARLLNPNLIIVARAEEEEAEAKLRKVGATKVISPYLAGGSRAVHAVFRPSVMQVMEMATRPEFIDLQMEEVIIREGSPLNGQTLKESRLAAEHGIMVAGILQPGGQLDYAPQGDAILRAGATVIALGQRKELALLERMAAGEKSVPNSFP
jgi:voltage-gated potassium channel